MDILYKGGALLAAQVEGAARLALAVPAAVLWNAAAAAAATTGASRSPADADAAADADAGAGAKAAAAAAPPRGSRCPFSGLLGSAATCPGARMAAAAAEAAAAAAAASQPIPGASTPAAPKTAAAAAAAAAGAAATTTTAAAPPLPGAGRCWWVEGRVTHVRRRPARHAFAYDVRLALLDLDDPPPWFAAQQARGGDGGGYLSAAGARAAAGTAGRVLLLTLPAAAGYAQNPISVYYCYDAVGGEEGEGEGGGKEKEGEGDAEGGDGGNGQSAAPQQQQKQQQQQQQQPKLRRCIAEVTNTPWGERVSFVFDPRGAAVPKSLHVSPFMDMRNVWLLRATDPRAAPSAPPAPEEAPEEAEAEAEEEERARAGWGGRGGHNNHNNHNSNSSRVVLSVLVDHPELGRYFDAQFVGRAVTGSALAEREGGGGGHRAGGGADGRSERGGLRMLWRYGFLPQRVALWIYVHAILLALKGVRVQPKPAAGTYAARAEAALERMAARGEGGGGGKEEGGEGGRRAATAAAAAAAGDGRAPPIPGGPGSGASWAGRAFAWRPAPLWPWYLD